MSGGDTLLAHDRSSLSRAFPLRPTPPALFSGPDVVSAALYFWSMRGLGWRWWALRPHAGLAVSSRATSKSHCILWSRLPRQRLQPILFLKPDPKSHKSLRCPPSSRVCAPDCSPGVEGLLVTWSQSLQLRWWKGQFFQEGHRCPSDTWLEQSR